MINNAIIQIKRMSSFKSRQRLDISNFVFYRIGMSLLLSTGLTAWTLSTVGLQSLKE